MRIPEQPILVTLDLQRPAERAVVRDHLLPGDTHAGVDVAAAVARWQVAPDTVFVRLRVVAPDVAWLSVLAFDEGGFGTLLTDMLAPGHVPSQLADVVAESSHVVALADEGALDPVDVRGVVERRSFAEIRLFETQVLGLRREDADLAPATWTASRDGDRAATIAAAAAARADLLALVCTGGDRITLH